jgi:hypothetical protein
MDILSQETLTILRDERVSQAVDELLDAHSTTDTKTVELTKPKSSSTGGEQPAAPSVRVRIRRIA